MVDAPANISMKDHRKECIFRGRLQESGFRCKLLFDHQSVDFLPNATDFPR